MRRSQRLAVVLTILLGPIGALAASACPNCKEAVAAQPSEVASTANGYNWSVAFMLVMPFTMLGTGAFAVVRAARRGGLPEL